MGELATSISIDRLTLPWILRHHAQSVLNCPVYSGKMRTFSSWQRSHNATSTRKAFSRSMTQSSLRAGPFRDGACKVTNLSI